MIPWTILPSKEYCSACLCSSVALTDPAHNRKFQINQHSVPHIKALLLYQRQVMPRTVSQKVCSSLLQRAQPCSRTLGTHPVILPLELAINITVNLCPPLTPPTLQVAGLLAQQSGSATDPFLVLDPTQSWAPSILLITCTGEVSLNTKYVVSEPKRLIRPCVCLCCSRDTRCNNLSWRNHLGMPLTLGPWKLYQSTRSLNLRTARLLPSGTCALPRPPLAHSAQSTWCNGSMWFPAR